MARPDRNWIASCGAEEIEEICLLAKERVRLLKLTQEERIKHMAEIVVGKVHKHTQNVIIFGLSADEKGIKNDVGFGSNSDSVLLFLEEHDEELGFLQHLYELLVKKDVWRKAIKDAMLNF